MDVPKLQVPPILEFQSIMGNKYLVERSIEEITQKLTDVQQEEEVKKQDRGDTPGLVNPQQPPVG